MVEVTVREGSADEEQRRGVVLKPKSALFLLFEGHRPTHGGARIDLTGTSEIRFGRAPTTTVRNDGATLHIGLCDPQVSTHHARMHRAGDTWTLEDAKSTNGTFVDGREVRAQELADRTRFVVGSAAFLYRSSLPSADEDGSVTWADAQSGRADGLLSLVPEHAEAIASLLRLAHSDVSILLRGESGTGKEVFARAIHMHSARAKGPFVAVNCAAIPATLVESTLFGHTKGAFSGALRDEEGYFRAAEGGTLFLDEIGDMPLPAQAALLRSLETREVVPVGATKPIRVNVRIISATLKEEHHLRPDLVARLAGYRHILPPLRDRIADLGLLVAEHLERLQVSDAQFAPDAVRTLVDYTFPLNVRELASTLKNATLLAKQTSATTVVQRRHLALTSPSLGSAEVPQVPLLQNHPAQSDAGDVRTRKPPVSDAARKEALLGYLRQTNANVSEVARLMDTTRAQVHRWTQKFDIDLHSFRKDVP